MNERESLSRWIGNFPRHPQQKNSFFSSDAEIVKTKTGYLLATVDTVDDEISFGLYKDPTHIGAIAVNASLSDLAACGADPIGILLACSWGPNTSLPWKKRFMKGVQRALKQHKCFLLGGDNGSAASTVIGVTSIGESKTKPLTRMGMKQGDYLVCTGSFGRGPALGFNLLMGKHDFSEKLFTPSARLIEGKRLKSLASSCMDTSDGLALTLSTLADLNHVGFELFGWEKIFDPTALTYCRKNRYSPLLLAFGEIGDLELVASVPAQSLQRALKAIPTLKVIGRVIPKNQGITLFWQGQKFSKFPLDLVSGAPRKSWKDFIQVFKKCRDTIAKLDASPRRD